MLLWADALDTAWAATATGIAVVVVIIGGGLAANRYERRHITQLLDEHRG